MPQDNKISNSELVRCLVAHKDKESFKKLFRVCMDKDIKANQTPQELDAIKEETETQLAKSKLPPEIKMLLVALNQHDRLTIIKRIQKHTMEHLFQKYPDFHTSKHHYDWWAFPMNVPEKWRWPKWNYHASIDIKEAQTLLGDPEFVESYLLGVNLYLKALNNNGWNDYPVRYARMLQSLSLFLTAAKEIGSPVMQTLEHLAKECIEYANQQHFEQEYHDYDLFQDGLSKVRNHLNPPANSSASLGS